MNIIINACDLAKGLSPLGTYTKKQAAIFNSTWTIKDGWSNNPIGKRCRAETMTEFIKIRSMKRSPLDW